MSAVWEYFTVKSETDATAECKKCKAQVSRGGTDPKRFNTTNLIKHLKGKHADLHEDFLKACKVKKSTQTSLTQPTLAESLERRENLPRDGKRALAITRKIAEFILLDDQPLSVVSNVGFQSLMEHLEPRYAIPSRHYFVENVIPQLHSEVRACIAEKVEKAKALSFTTDIWSSDHRPLSLLSLTVHWIDSDFTLRRAVLHAREFRGSHAASAIMHTMGEMLRNWNMDKRKVHVVLRDNAANMKKAMDDFGVPSLGCFAHTLQLVVHEGVLSQRAVSDALANGRKIVAHFKHSPKAYSSLEDLQEELNIPPRRLQQDVQTRWSSTKHMIDSLVYQKRALHAYSAEENNTLPVILTANQWGLLEKASKLLAPFEELTTSISAVSATAADVIPSVHVLTRFLSKESEDDQGIKTMKATLLDAVHKRFRHVESEPLYAVATLLDPRYKDKYFTTAENLGHAKETLKGELVKTEEELSTALPSNVSVSKPAEKIPRMEGASSSLGSIFDEILEETSSTASGPSEQITPGAVIEMESYLCEAPLGRKSSPFDYWRTNQARLPILAATAAKFLCAPCTSVESERLFSSASIIIDEHRSSLTAEHAEMLIFLKRNLPILKCSSS